MQHLGKILPQIFGYVNNNYFIRNYFLQCQSVINQGNKKPQNKKERDDKVEKRCNSESKESRETKLDGPGENISEDEAQSNIQRKRGSFIYNFILIWFFGRKL